MEYCSWNIHMFAIFYDVWPDIALGDTYATTFSVRCVAMKLTDDHLKVLLYVSGLCGLIQIVLLCFLETMVVIITYLVQH